MSGCVTCLLLPPGAVYSPQGVSPVPYFSLLHRMRSARNKEVDAARAELHRVNATLGKREEDLQRLKEKICNIQEMNRTLQDAVRALQLEAEENRRERKDLEGELHLQAIQLETERQRHRRDVSNLHEHLQASSKQIEKMTQLSQDYRALQIVFQSPLTRKKQNLLSAVGKVPQNRSRSPPTFLSTYLRATGHTSEQLLQVQNRVLDDFDHYLENRISTSETALDEEMQMTFLSRLCEISEELSLLERQREGLEQRSARSVGSLVRTHGSVGESPGIRSHHGSSHLRAPLSEPNDKVQNNRNHPAVGQRARHWAEGHQCNDQP
ncbi:uncharacterized protein LOC142663850 [Rhinoderma darwinii]|uniref:uncharacterized protein LOC142663850 n=1 Tax=Rhinoderma darwinii TaxID=43563 RepID=UPI003F67DE5F